MSVKRLTPNSIANLFMADEAWHDSEYVAAADYDAAAARIVELEAAKDGAYLERNKCVALIARMAMALGYWAGTAKTAIEGWSEDWHGCVYIDLPAGQVSWHYHDSQAHLFDWLPPYCGEWDGHDTPEKYRRVLDRSAMPNARAEKAEAERDALKTALLVCARQAEALKRDCGMDPESPQAIRNAQYQNISTTAHIALGTIRGPRVALGER